MTSSSGMLKPDASKAPITSDSPPRSTKKHKSLQQQQQPQQVDEHIAMEEEPRIGNLVCINRVRMEVMSRPNSLLWMCCIRILWFGSCIKENMGLQILTASRNCDPLPESEEAARPRSPVVPISPEKYHSLFQPWRGALILKLLGKTVSLKIMEQRTRDLWKLEWGNQLIDLDHGYFLARFYKREDYFHVLEGGLWIVMGHYLTVAKWKMNFRPSVGIVQNTMVWVRFPELPMELFDEEVLFAMGNTIGKAIKIDDTTLIVRRGRYARVCIEVDLEKPLVPFITVLGVQQRVEYEGLHLICFGCGKYDHRSDGCPDNGQGSTATPTAQLGSATEREDAMFGPWMLPKYHRRRPTGTGGGR